MKRFLLIMFLPVLFMLSVFSQGLSEHIADCFRKGNAPLLRGSLANQVNVSMPGLVSDSDKRKTELQLEEFFRQTTPKGFEVIHSSDKGDTGFLIGILNTQKGKFRVHLLMRKTNSKYLIHQIRIEQFNE
ncbi:MAG: DUF4783 domain-containing protein [Bacteroidales bacterium]